MHGFWRRFPIILLFLSAGLISSAQGQQFGGPNGSTLNYAPRTHMAVAQIPFEYLGTPTANQLIGIFKNEGPTIYFPPSLTSVQQGPRSYSSGDFCGTSPSSCAAGCGYLLQVNNNTQCTLTISTATPCGFTVTTCTVPWSLATGQVLTLVAPATINSEANLEFTISGYLP